MNKIMMQALLRAYEQVQSPLEAAQLREHAYHLERRLIIEEAHQRRLARLMREYGGPKTLTEKEFLETPVSQGHTHKAPRGRSSAGRSLRRLP